MPYRSGVSDHWSHLFLENRGPLRGPPGSRLFLGARGTPNSPAQGGLKQRGPPANAEK